MFFFFASESFFKHIIFTSMTQYRILQMVLMYTTSHTIIMLSNWHLMLIKDLNPASFSAKLYMDYFSIMIGPYTADRTTKKLTMHLYIAAL